MSDHEQHIPPGSGGGPPAEGPEAAGRTAPGEGDGVPASGADGSESPRKERSVLKTILAVLGIFAGVVLLLIVLFLIALQTNWGGTYFGDFLITLANPFAEAETEYDELNGNFVTRIELTDLRMYRVDSVYVDTVSTAPLTIRRVHADSLEGAGLLTRALPGETDPEAGLDPELAAAFDTLLVDTLMLARIDTFRIRYNLLSLLWGRVHFREIHVANPRLWARQQPDSTWDLLAPFGADTTATEPGQARFTFQVDDLDVTGGELVAYYHEADSTSEDELIPSAADELASVFRARDVSVHAGDAVIEQVISLRLDTLYGAYSPRGVSYWTELAAGGEIQENEVYVSSLSLSSPLSLVTAGGRLRLPTAEDTSIEDIDFSLSADPIAFQDLEPFVPALNPEHSATIEVEVAGSSRLVNVDASGSLSDGGAFSLTGRVTPDADGPVEYVAEARLDNIDPSSFTGPGTESTLLNGNLDVNLVGTELQRLDGTASASLTRSRIGGLPLASASLDATFTEGEADFDVATTFNGSTVSATGTARLFDDLPTYRLDGRATDFNLASLGQTGQQTDLDAAFTVNGTGFDPQSAEIDAALRFSPSSINAYVLNDGRMELHLANGEVSYGFRFLFPDGLLVANGTADLEAPLQYAIERGRFENVDLAALLGQDQQSSLTGTFRMQGVGTDPQQMSAEAVLEMEPSTYGRYELTDGTIEVDLESGLLRVDALADLAEAGRFDFAATTRPFDDRPLIRVTEGAFTNVDIGPLLGQQSQDSDLSGTATFTLRGFDPETMQLDGALTLANSRINQQEITSVDVDVALSNGQMRVDGDVSIPGGSITLAATALPFRDVPTYEITHGQFRNINLAAFTGDAGLESNLSGSLSLSGTGMDPSTMDVQGSIQISDSRLNQQQINSATITGSLVNGTIDGRIALDVPEGQTRLAGTVRPFADVPTYTIREGTFAGINVGALIGKDAWQTNLAGTVSLSGRGFEPDSMSTEGTITFRESTINEVALTRGSISGRLDDGFTEFDAALLFTDGSARVSGSGRLFDEVPTYDVSGSLVDVNVGNMLRTDTLEAMISADFALAGSGTDPRTMNVEGRITSRDAAYEGADIDTLHSEFALADGVLQLDSLLIRSTAVDARGSGVVALYDTTTASDLQFAAVVKDLAPFRDFVDAEKFQLEEGNVAGSIYGTPGTLRFDVTGTISSLIYEDIRLSEFDGTVVGELGPDRTLNIAEVRGEFSAISLPQLLIEHANLDVTYTPAGIAFEGRITIEEGRYADLAGRVATDPEQQQVYLETLQLTLDQQQWQLLQEASISYGEEYRVSNFLLYSGDQQLAVDGVIDPDGEQNLIMTIENFVIDKFTDVLNYDGLQGTLNGSLMLSGPADAPVMSGALNADLASFGTAVGDLRLLLDYEQLRLEIDALLTHQDGSSLTAVGYLPLDLRVANLSEGGVEGELVDTSVDIDVAADSFGIGWIRPFVDPETISEIDGRLTADLNVGGTINAPVLDGTARYSGGRIGVPELGLTYRDIAADFTLAQNNVQVENLIIRSGEGSIRGSGTVSLPQLTLGEFNVDLDAENFRAIDSQEYEFVINGDMVLSGTTDLPVLSGDVEVVAGEILLTAETTSPELELVELSTEEIQTVEQRFGIHVTAEDTTTFSLYNALAMDLDVGIERNTWIRSQVNPVMDIQFSGNLSLEKEHYQDVNIFGTIEVVPQRSRIIQFGRRFEITSGTLTFQGPATDPLIDIAAEYEPGTFGLGASGEGVVITLSLEGRMSEQLDLTLGSEPQLAYADIVSYIATGRPAGAATSLGGDLLGTGGELAFGQLTAVLEGVAQAGLGLDVIALEYEAGRPVITAGTSVSPRLFVSVSQPIDDPGNTSTQQIGSSNRPIFTVEYEITNWLLARLVQYGQSLNVNLQWEYAY